MPRNNQSGFAVLPGKGPGLLLLMVALTGVAGWCASSGRYHCLVPGREHRLMCAINRHTGYAHMTRGMNLETIDALDRDATPEDLPVLQNLLFSEDRIAAMTAAEVLQRRGPAGNAVLADAFRQAVNGKDSSRAALIQEYGGLGPRAN